MEIEKFIGIGRENAVKRGELSTRLALDDRIVRREIAKARERGVNIVNDGSGVGYWISDDTADLAEQYRKEHKRALKILYRLKTMRRMLKERGVDLSGN